MLRLSVCPSVRRLSVTLCIVAKRCALNLWSLEERRVRADLLEVYKIVHGLSAIPLKTCSNLIIRVVVPGVILLN